MTDKKILKDVNVEDVANKIKEADHYVVLTLKGSELSAHAKIDGHKPIVEVMKAMDELKLEIIESTFNES